MELDAQKHDWIPPTDVMWVDGQASSDAKEGGSASNLNSLLYDIEVDDDEDAEAVASYVLEPVTLNDGVRTSISSLKEGEHESGFRNSVVRLLTPLANAWNTLVMYRMRQHNHQLVFQYFLQLQNFFGAERVPPGIAMVFDAIFEKYNAASIPTTDRSHELQVISAAANFFESHTTKQLRRLLHVTLELLEDIVEVMSRIQSKLDSDGYLVTGSSEHSLCRRSCIELAYLMKRMELISSVLRDRIPECATNDDVNEATKIMYKGWLYEMEDCFSKDISFSLADRLKCLYISVYESMIRLAVSLCYYIQLPEVTALEHTKLLIIASDFTICVKDLRENIQSVLNSYQYDLEDAKKIISESSSSQPDFSRESKVKRQCDNILNWTAEFTECVKSMKIASSQLAQLDQNREPDQYKRFVQDLNNTQEVLYDYSKLLQALLNTQSVLIEDLCQNCEPIVEVPYITHDAQNDIDNVNMNAVETSNSIDIPEPLEFEISEKTDMTANVEIEAENKDEIFVGVFCDGDDEGSVQYEGDLNENDKTLQKLYSGVVHQLKSALVPVKSKMKIREKEAVTKLYGAVRNADIPFDEFDTNEADDENDCVRESSDEEESLPPVPKPRNISNKYKYEDNFEDDAVTTSTTFFDGDFMKELRLKLNTAPSAHMLSANDEEELTFEGSSQCDDED